MNPMLMAILNIARNRAAMATSARLSARARGRLVRAMFWRDVYAALGGGSGSSSSSRSVDSSGNGSGKA